MKLSLQEWKKKHFYSSVWIYQRQGVCLYVNILLCALTRQTRPQNDLICSWVSLQTDHRVSIVSDVVCRAEEPPKCPHIHYTCSWWYSNQYYLHTRIFPTLLWYICNFVNHVFDDRFTFTTANNYWPTLVFEKALYHDTFVSLKYRLMNSSGSIPGRILPYLGMIGRFRSNDLRFWGFSIRLGRYIIPTHNPLDPLFLQKKSVGLYHI